MSSSGTKSIVIAYEDKYFGELHLLIKVLRRDHGFPGLCLEGRSVHGTGGFIDEIPKYLRMPLKQTKQPPDLVVCLGDADCPANLTPDAPPTPVQAEAGALDSWLTELEKRWRDFLLYKGNIDGSAAMRLKTVCLRWNKESILLANPDALLDYAAQRGRRAEVEALLDGCKPSPLALADEAFMLSYRRTSHCMDLVLREVEGRKYKKGRDDEDLLKIHIKPYETRRALALRRCPDLGRLLDELR